MNLILKYQKISHKILENALHVDKLLQAILSFIYFDFQL